MKPVGDDRRAVIENFTATELARVRDLVGQVGVRAGLSASRTGDLVLAVNEVAANAIIHAGGVGWLTVEQTADGVMVEVRDRGTGLPHPVAMELPAPQLSGGRGLWLARTLCDQLTFSADPDGHCVRLFTAAPRIA